ncbi:unnamed protein product [Pelagomonas calceolata]|uniref:Uncharacterized protein n=1 Tax=Pelagomonas calceolata TaxID=35677 RepID=A0A8J2SLU3_9STRA|nr:unnamed protein product [Pelagomonas calceolata]
MRTAALLVAATTTVRALRPAMPSLYQRRAPVVNLLDAKGQSIAPVTPAGGGASDKDHDVLLGELIFSSRDPREDVASAPELYTEDFLKFVSDKAEDSDDMEEREGLKSLVDMIRATLDMVEKMTKEAEEAQARIEAEVEAEAERAAALARGEVVVDTEQVLGAAAVASGIEQYAEMAREARSEGPGEAGLYGDALGRTTRCCRNSSRPRPRASSRRRRGRVRTALNAIIEAVNSLSAKRLEQAAARLGTVMQQGSPEKMFAKIQELAIINQIDAPLVELLDANRQQALAAGAAGAGAAELMKNLANRCRDEMDKRIAKDAPEKRAFEPKEGLALSFGEDYGKDAAKKTQEGPEVDPTKFIAACQQLIADFGNIDDNGEPLMVRINQIAAIAETVATELYGDVTSAREQQDLMWNEATTSVFDLEAAELAAEQKGEQMPWHNDSYDGKLPDGFTADQAGQYIKKVGG